MTRVSHPAPCPCACMRSCRHTHTRARVLYLLLSAQRTMSIVDRRKPPYVLKEKIGRGAFGVVFRGEDPKYPGVSVAVKVIELEVLDDEIEEIRREIEVRGEKKGGVGKGCVMVVYRDRTHVLSTRAPLGTTCTGPECDAVPELDQVRRVVQCGFGALDRDGVPERRLHR